MDRAYPTGWCWCGCGEATAPRSLFRPGHDAAARAMILKHHYQGDTATMVLAHGYEQPGPHGFERTTTPEARGASGTMPEQEAGRIPLPESAGVPREVRERYERPAAPGHTPPAGERP
ncbi:MAG TPA: hypothetical protein VG276_28225 [Actinomycetes bacterium]|jgi:hypothetical protein|nr:hypothetical protein [Actinomycetes bacterium]